MSANVSEAKRLPDPSAPAGRLVMTRARASAAPAAMRRRLTVRLAKRVLPAAAVLLLAAIAVWPEMARQAERARLTLRAGLPIPESGEVTKAAYHGVDDRGRPYTMTADRARQRSPDRIDLSAPKGDITLQSGNWMMVQSREGVYLPRENSLDLSQDVQLYRDDGTTIATDATSVDLKAGVATSAAQVHAEGPLGTLDSQGFTLIDRGAAIQFQGPGRALLNAAGRPATK